MITFQDFSVKIHKIRSVFISGLVSNVITYTKAPSLETASFLAMLQIFNECPRLKVLFPHEILIKSASLNKANRCGVVKPVSDFKPRSAESSKRVTGTQMPASTDVSDTGSH